MKRVKKTYKTVLVNMELDRSMIDIYADSGKTEKIMYICKDKSIPVLGDIFKEGDHWMRVTIRIRKEGKRKSRGKNLYLFRRPKDSGNELGYGLPTWPESVGFEMEYWICNLSPGIIRALFGIFLQEGEYIPVSIYAQHVNKPAQSTKNA